MTGYKIKKILSTELVLSQAKVSPGLLIITLTGIILLSLSIMTEYKILNPPAPFFSLFLGMGIIFTSAGIMFMIQKKPDSFSFNKQNSMLIFSENKQEYSMPFSSFSKLLITGKLSHSKNATSTIFQLNLISHSGSTLLLCESGDKSELQKAAGTIIGFIDIDLLSGADVLHNGATTYPETPSVFPHENIMSVKSAVSDNTSVYKWNSRKSIAAIFLLGAVIYGFNYVIFACAFPEMNRINTGLYVAGAILIVIDVFFISTLVFYISGINTAEITDSGFSFRQMIYGFNMNKKFFTRDEIAMITCGFTSDENKITIFTKRGVELLNEMKLFSVLNNLNDTSVLLTLVPKVMELRKNIIEIDGTPLYYYEKLYLANQWSARLNLMENAGNAY